MPDGQEPGADPGLEEAGGVESVILEIDTASPDLGDFLRWLARDADENPEQAKTFAPTVSQVYNYCRAKNEQLTEEEE